MIANIGLRHVQAKYLPCQEELIIGLVNRGLFQVDFLKKLFLASLKAGFDDLSGIIIDKLITLDGHLDTQWPSVVYAVKYKRYKILEKLLDKNFDVNIIENDFPQTALITAVIQNDIQTAKVLIKKGAGIEKQDSLGHAALSEVVRQGPDGADIIKLLINCGANIEFCGGSLKNPVLLEAVRLYRLNAVKILLDDGANINAKNQEGYTPLAYAIRHSRSDLVKILVESGKNADIIKQNKGNALILAARYNAISIMNMLIEFGANIEAKNEFGNTALLEESVKSNIYTINTLIEKGTDVNAKNNSGYSAEFLALINFKVICFIKIMWHKINLIVKNYFTKLDMPKNTTEAQSGELLVDNNQVNIYDANNNDVKVESNIICTNLNLI